MSTPSLSSLPLRAICALVDDVLRDMSREFDRLYATIGRPSIPPEHLLRAQRERMTNDVIWAVVVVEWAAPIVVVHSAAAVCWCEPVLSGTSRICPLCEASQ
jgi:hypothetical protein